MYKYSPCNQFETTNIPSLENDKQHTISAISK